MLKGREPANILGSGNGASSAGVLQHGVRVDHVPKDETVHHQPEGVELVFLAFPVFLLPTLAANE